ncbi:BTB/POZ protein [Xylaria cubensis]|nr:BTB/POZ protein [Xylaria cubensis]
MATKELIKLLKEVYSDGKYSDLTISCGGKEHQVHKALVCTRSDFFAAACRDFTEGHKQVVNLPDDDPNAVEIMVYYLYHGDYHAPQHTTSRDQITQDNTSTPLSPKPVVNTTEQLLVREPSPDSTLDGMTADYTPSILGPQSISVDLALHAAVYAVAEKYTIQGLKNLAMRKFKRTATEYWDSNDFLEAVRGAYTCTADTNQGLKDIVVTILHEHPVLLDKEETQLILKESNMLAYDLVMYARHSNLSTEPN